MTKNLASLTNGYIANIGVSYIKLHNLHWNVTGSQFKAVHEYLETLYDAMAGVLDEAAEAMKMEGEYPLASLKEYLAAATIEELGAGEVDVKGALKIVLADLEALKAQAEAIRAAANGEDNYNLANIMEDGLANYTKNIWFVRSMLR